MCDDFLHRVATTSDCHLNQAGVSRLDRPQAGNAVAADQAEHVQMLTRTDSELFFSLTSNLFVKGKSYRNCMKKYIE